MNDFFFFDSNVKIFEKRKSINMIKVIFTFYSFILKFSRSIIYRQYLNMLISPTRFLEIISMTIWSFQSSEKKAEAKHKTAL